MEKEGSSSTDRTFDINTTEKVTISMDEVKLIIHVIDIVAKRGGFVPRDFLAVGKLYDNLIAHVEK